MAERLRQGETLTEYACPVCSAPLFRTKNRDLWCAKCEKKVIIIREEDAPKLAQATAFGNIEMTLLTKIEEIRCRLQGTEDSDELQKLSTTLSQLLDSLEKIRRTKKT
jgi:uncharacterized Zn finger protein (UPF0148 family)